MANLEELTALEDHVTIDGTVYTLRPTDATDHALIEREVKKGRVDPIAVARQLTEGLPAEERKEILSRAYDDAMRARNVTADELEQWTATLPGALFCFWLSIRKAHPEIDYDRSCKLVAKFGEDCVRAAMPTLLGMPTEDPLTPTQETPAGNT